MWVSQLNKLDCGISLACDVTTTAVLKPLSAVSHQIETVNKPILKYGKNENFGAGGISI